MDITEYRKRVQTAVVTYCATVTPTAKGSRYLHVLQENTERLQGMLVLMGYEMCGGEHQKMIEKAALAIEMTHAYIQCVERNMDIIQALRAQHEAEIILANLDADIENRMKAVSITNRTLMLANLARLDTTSEEDRLAWKATELTLNPIHVGQVLAGSDCDANNAVTPLATDIGKKLAQDETIDIPQFFDDLRKITW